MTAITDRAFIIHSRSFGETSIIFDFLTEENGLISAVLKGAKKRKDGSKMTCAEWAERHGFLYAEKEIPDDWIN